MVRMMKERTLAEFCRDKEKKLKSKKYYSIIFSLSLNTDKAQWLAKNVLTVQNRYWQYCVAISILTRAGEFTDRLEVSERRQAQI